MAAILFSFRLVFSAKKYGAVKYDMRCIYSGALRGAITCGNWDNADSKLDTFSEGRLALRDKNNNLEDQLKMEINQPMYNNYNITLYDEPR